MVRTVDHVVTGAAVLAEQLLRGPAEVRDVRTGIQAAGMITLVVALLAQERTAHPQHAVLGGAVGIVTDGTVFAHWGVFPQEWAAFLGMALVTGLVDSVLHQLRGAGGSMGVMTVGTYHLGLPYRMAGSSEALGAFILMALETDIGLGGLRQDRVVQTYRIVTIHAGQIGR